MSRAAPVESVPSRAVVDMTFVQSGKMYVRRESVGEGGQPSKRPAKSVSNGGAPGRPDGPALQSDVRNALPGAGEMIGAASRASNRRRLGMRVASLHDPHRPPGPVDDERSEMGRYSRDRHLPTRLPGSLSRRWYECNSAIRTARSSQQCSCVKPVYDFESWRPGGRARISHLHLLHLLEDGRPTRAGTCGTGLSRPISREKFSAEGHSHDRRRHGPGKNMSRASSLLQCGL